MDNIERNNQIRYELFSNTFGSMVIQEPDGYNDDTRSQTRDKQSRGIISKTEINLTFYGSASDFLSTVFRSFGVSERVLLSKYVKDNTSISENWKLRYVQELDMGTFKEISRTNAVTVKAVEGGLFKDIKGRKSEKYDLISNESADGVQLNDLKTYNMIPQPRGILFRNSLSDKQSDYRINSEDYRESYSYTYRSIPLIPINTPSSFIAQPIFSSESSNTITHAQNGGVGSNPVGLKNNLDLFIRRSDIKRAVDITVKLEFRIEDVDYKRASDKEMEVQLRICEAVGDDDVVKESRTLTLTEVSSSNQMTVIDAHHTKIGQQYTLNYNTQIDLEIGDSVGVVFQTQADLGVTLVGDGFMDTYLSVTQSEVIVVDSADYDVTDSQCIKPFDLFDRLIAKITGIEGIFRSSLFEPGGEYENVVVNHGLWARQVPNTYTDEDGEEISIQFTTSWKDAFQSYNYLEPLTWFVELEGNKQVVRIESAKHTMQNFIGVSLNAVDKIEHEASKPDFFSKITIGHEKSLEYEDKNGLGEYNGLSEFGTHIKDGTEYKAVNKYRVDPVGHELTRRNKFQGNGNTDDARDKDIFMHDCKWTGTNFVHRLWQDDFDESPKGIFDPDTAWNLRLSPMNRLFYGHGYSVKRGLYHFRDNKIRFNSSNANQNLTTIDNSFSLSENGSIFIKSIENARIEAEKTKLTFKLTQELEDAFNGFTSVKGKLVPNVFGLIEYFEKGEVKYGRLVKLNASEEATLEMINARL